MPDARSCAAGIVLLGTPHTFDRKRAEEFCRLAVLAFEAPALPSLFEYGTRLITTCRGFEAMNIPVFSLYELQTTKLPRLKKDFIVKRDLARLDTAGEREWPVESNHKLLCQHKIDVPLYKALFEFFSEHYHERSLSLRPKPPQRTSSNFDRASLPASMTQDPRWLEESPVASPTSSQSTSYSSKAAPARLPSERTIPKMTLPISTGGRVEYHIPAEGNFVLRGDDILSQVEKVLNESDPWQEQRSTEERIRTFALCGKRGTGKSACALHFVHKHKHNYDSLFWINADSTISLFDEYTEIAHYLHLADTAKIVDRFACQKLVRDWLENKTGKQRKRWLLVFDGVIRPRDLKHFWPYYGLGDVLITGQCSVEELTAFTGKFGTQVKPFGMDVATEFLKTLSPEQMNDPAQLLQALQIAEILGGLPLSLVALSDMIKQNRVDDDLVRKISRRRHSRASSTGSETLRRDLSDEPLDSLRLILDPKLNELAASSRPLMDLIAILDPSSIQVSILEAAESLKGLPDFPSNPDDFDDAIEDLVNRKLISEDRERGEIICHGLVADVVQLKMSPERREAVFETAIIILKSRWPSMSMEARHNTQRWDVVSKLLRHVRRLQQLHETDRVELDLGPKTSIMFANLLNDAGWVNYERGDYEDARAFAEYAQAIARTVDLDGLNVSREHLLELRSQVAYSLGAIAQITHQHSESLEMHAEMLVLRKRIRLEHGNGRRDAFLAHAYNEMGNDFMTSDEYSIAEGFYDQSIKLYKSIVDYEHEWLILPSVNLGLAYWLQGRHSDAEALIRPVLEEHERRLKSTEAGTMKTGRLLYAMGNIYDDLGRKEESFEYHSRALEKFEKAIGLHHNRSTDVMYRLADHHCRDKNYEAAMELIDKALLTLNTRPLFDREMARFYFKKADVMHKTREFVNPIDYQIYAKTAASTYAKYRPKMKPASELTEKDYNELVMFWSR